MDKGAGDYKDQGVSPTASAGLRPRAGAPQRRSHLNANLEGNLIAGLLTVAPIFAVWLVFDFLLNALSAAGHPMALALTDFIDTHVPLLAPLFASPFAHGLVAVAVALLTLYAIGAVASRMIGQRMIGLFERIIARIPLVETIYSAIKKLVEVLRPAAGGAQRVVLVDFPAEGMKTLAFVMQVYPDAATGDPLATVFVPTAPNPTTGYLQILPVAKLIPTDIPAEQAMAMILSGGAVTPDRLSLASRI